MTFVKRFLDDQSGAATIDLVALSAGALLVGIMVVYAIYNIGVSNLVNVVNDVDPGFDRTVVLLQVDNMNAD